MLRGRKEERKLDQNTAVTPGPSAAIFVSGVVTLILPPSYTSTVVARELTNVLLPWDYISLSSESLNPFHSSSKLNSLHWGLTYIDLKVLSMNLQESWSIFSPFPLKI